MSFDLISVVCIVSCARMLLNIRDVMTMSEFAETVPSESNEWFPPKSSERNPKFHGGFWSHQDSTNKAEAKPTQSKGKSVDREVQSETDLDLEMASFPDNQPAKDNITEPVYELQ